MGATQLIVCCQVSSVLSSFSLSKNHAYIQYASWNACGTGAEIDHIFHLARRIPMLPLPHHALQLHLEVGFLEPSF